MAVSELVSQLASVAGIITPFLGGGAAALGVVPRAGPLRAIALALQSKFRSADQISVRDGAVFAVVQRLKVCRKDQYIVVKGPKGIGKSCVVATATQYTSGVLHITVQPGMLHKTIVREVLGAVANVRISFVDPVPSARRVLWFYKLLLPPPIVVLQAAERAQNDGYAQITSAVRDLLTFGLRVVVDSSPNSLQNEAVNTWREVVIDLDPMDKEALLSIPELAQLFDRLREANLEHLVWAGLGGVPSAYFQLDTTIKAEDPSRFSATVVEFIRTKLTSAVRFRDEMLAEQPKMANIIELFQRQAEVPHSILKETQSVLSSPNKVLRIVSRHGQTLLVPADAAMNLVLRHNFVDVPSSQELQQMTSPITDPSDVNTRCRGG